MMFETELKIFGVVNGDKTSRADGMLREMDRWPFSLKSLMNHTTLIHVELV